MNPPSQFIIRILKQQQRLKDNVRVPEKEQEFDSNFVFQETNKSQIRFKEASTVNLPVYSSELKNNSSNALILQSNKSIPQLESSTENLHSTSKDLTKNQEKIQWENPIEISREIHFPVSQLVIRNLIKTRSINNNIPRPNPSSSHASQQSNIPPVMSFFPSRPFSENENLSRRNRDPSKDGFLPYNPYLNKDVRFDNSKFNENVNREQKSRAVLSSINKQSQTPIVTLSSRNDASNLDKQKTFENSKDFQDITQLSSFGRGLTDNHKVLWNEPMNHQKMGTENISKEKPKVRVESNGITFSTSSDVVIDDKNTASKISENNDISIEKQHAKQTVEQLSSSLFSSSPEKILQFIKSHATVIKLNGMSLENFTLPLLNSFGDPISSNKSDNMNKYKLIESESQILIRKITPNADKKINYNKCSHSFHLWMCPQVFLSPLNPQPTMSTDELKGSLLFGNSFGIQVTTDHPPTPSSNLPITENTGLQLFQNPSTSLRGTTLHRPGSTLFGEPIFTKPTVPTVPFPPFTTTRPRMGSLIFGDSKTTSKSPSPNTYDKCSHPFHTWLCPKSTTSTQSSKLSLFSIASSNLGKSLKASGESIPETTTRKRYEKCHHAFHAWLCPNNPPSTTPDNSRRGSLTSPEVTTRRTGGLILPFEQTTTPELSTTTPVITTRRGSANFQVESFITTEPPVKLSTTKKPRTSTYKPYDKCSHSFHSWLCQKPIRNRLSSLAIPSKVLVNPNRGEPKSTTVAPTTVSPSTEKTTEALRSGSILFSESLSKPDTTIELTTKPPTTKMNICDHPLHSWMCFPSSTTTKNEITTTLSRGFIDSESDSTQNIKIKKSTKSSWDEVDPCTHAFHSWLCKPSHRRLTSPTIQRKLPEPKSMSSSLLLGNAQTTTMRSTITDPTTVPSTTVKKVSGGIFDSLPQGTKPKEPVTEKPRGKQLNSESKIPKNMSDPCKHAFHSYLCSSTIAPRIATNWSPKQSLAKNLLDTAPTSTQPKPKKAGGTFNDQIQTKPTTMAPKYDKCNHPFHSWLCEVARGLTKDNKDTTAIDTLIDSDRFLLKSANLPNIRRLPLDHDGPSLIEDFAPDHFVDMNKLKLVLAKMSRNLKTDENDSSNFETFTTSTVPTVPSQLISTPSQFDFKFGQKVIPTLPAFNSIEIQNSRNEDFTFDSSSSNSNNVRSSALSASRFNIPTVPPSPFFNAPEMIAFDLRDVPTVPPRLEREVMSPHQISNQINNSNRTVTTNSNHQSDTQSSFLLSWPLNLSVPSPQRPESSINPSYRSENKPPEKNILNRDKKLYQFNSPQLHTSSHFLPFPSITETRVHDASIVQPKILGSIPSSAVDFKRQESSRFKFNLSLSSSPSKSDIIHAKINNKARYYEPIISFIKNEEINPNILSSPNSNRFSQSNGNNDYRKVVQNQYEFPIAVNREHLYQNSSKITETKDLQFDDSHKIDQLPDIVYQHVHVGQKAKLHQQPNSFYNNKLEPIHITQTPAASMFPSIYSFHRPQDSSIKSNPINHALNFESKRISNAPWHSQNSGRVTANFQVRNQKTASRPQNSNNKKIMRINLNNSKTILKGPNPSQNHPVLKSSKYQISDYFKFPPSYLSGFLVPPPLNSRFLGRNWKEQVYHRSHRRSASDDDLHLEGRREHLLKDTFRHKRLYPAQFNNRERQKHLLYANPRRKMLSTKVYKRRLYLKGTNPVGNFLDK